MSLSSISWPFYTQSLPLLFQCILHAFIPTIETIRTIETSQFSLALDQLLAPEKKRHSCAFYTEGSLRKLYQYASYIKETSLVAQDFLQETEILWQQALIYQQEKIGNAEKNSYLLNQQADKIAPLLIAFIEFFKSDESVLLSLLNYHARIDHIYGVSTTLRLLCQGFLGDFQETMRYICHRYAERGFHYLLPHIQQKMKLLQRTHDLSRKK